MIVEKSILRLHSSLCADLGFELSQATLAALVQDHPQDVEQLTQAIFRAEALDPDLADRHFYRQVRDKIRQAITST